MLFLLSLPLLMLRVGADHANDTFTVDDLALITHFLDRRPYFHFRLRIHRLPGSRLDSVSNRNLTVAS
jgi:hypothetical protein